MQQQETPETPGTRTTMGELFDRDILRREFELPENIVPVCLLPLGYRSDTCPTSRNHGVRKELAELVEYK